MLKENDAVATFFTIGEQISDKTDYVETIQRMAAEGHQIGTHSYDHAATGGGNGVDMTRQSPGEADRRGANGPAGHRGRDGQPRRLRCSARRAATSTTRSSGTLQPYITGEIGWNVDTEDWRRPGADAIAERLLSAKSGDVVLMHDGGGDRSQTIEALKIALPQLKAEGYKFVTIDQLLAYDDAKALAQELAAQQVRRNNSILSENSSDNLRRGRPWSPLVASMAVVGRADQGPPLRVGMRVGRCRG